MSTKTLIFVGLAAAAAYLLFARRQSAAPTPQSAPGSNRNAYIAAGISAGGKVINALFGSQERIGGQGNPTYVTSYDQISGSKVVGNGFVTSYD